MSLILKVIVANIISYYFIQVLEKMKETTIAEAATVKLAEHLNSVSNKIDGFKTKGDE